MAQVKGLKPAEVRQALCDAGLSPVGDKNELLKVMVVVECAVMTIYLIIISSPEAGRPLLLPDCGDRTRGGVWLRWRWEGGREDWV